MKGSVRTSKRCDNAAKTERREEVKQQIADLLKFEEDERKLEVIRQMLIR